jgi:leader peptidase (prepilin peptidase)/N-methyltransferase
VIRAERVVSNGYPAVAGTVVATGLGSGRRLSPRARRASAIVGAVAVVLCFVRFGVTAHAFVGAFFAAVLAYLAAFDLEHRLIPNRVVLPAAAIVLVAQTAIYPDRSFEWFAAAVGAAAFFLITLLVYPPGLGMGDVKLALLLGAALGTHVVGAVLVGTFAAAIFGAALVMRDGAAARRRAIAFGPFLAFGALVALLLS